MTSRAYITLCLVVMLGCWAFGVYLLLFDRRWGYGIAFGIMSRVFLTHALNVAIERKLKENA